MRRPPHPRRRHACWLLLALAVVLGGGGLRAQEIGYRAHVKLAERFDGLGEGLKAAEQYAGAYRAKPKKHEYAYAAAERFYLGKDYERAAELYGEIARRWRDYPIAGLRLARSLKQAGRFEEATAAYKDYLSYYGGDDLEIIRGIVEDEVRGAAMAQQALGAFHPDVVVEAFGPQVNGPANEMAPMPLSPEAVYFLSDRGGLMRMYRTVREGGAWGPAEVAAQFPVVPGMHVGSGSLSPTGDRFYFSLCDARERPTQPAARCRLYVIARAADGAWTSPQALPAYINVPGSSAAHPFVYREGAREVLLFASDVIVPEARGGMDLFRAERALDSDGTDFTFPEHLGAVVNGRGDEVSPYYDPEARTLYFASNGFLNMGGFDVFRTLGDRASWNRPENLGAPVNSAADDYYYRELPGTTLATMSSNRAVRDEKTRTSNEDLFLVRPGNPTLAVDLQVVDEATGQPLPEVSVAAFVREAGAPERLVRSARTDDGFFALELPMGRTVELRFQREGYEAATATVDVPRRDREGFQAPRVRMRRIVVTLADVQDLEESRTAPPSARLPTAAPPPTRPQSSAPTASAPTSSTPAPSAPAPGPLETPRIVAAGGDPQAAPPPPAPRAEPPPPPPVRVSQPAAPQREYRIQIEARGAFEPEHRRYIEVRRLGEVTSDYVEGRRLYRVLVGRYDSMAEAEAALAEVRRVGWRDAFVAGFEGGVYRGAVR